MGTSGLNINGLPIMISYNMLHRIYNFRCTFFEQVRMMADLLEPQLIPFFPRKQY